MTTPFSWKSEPTVIKKAFKRDIRQQLRDALDLVFEGTLNPKVNRQEWYDWLQSPLSGKLATVLGVTRVEDLSLMLPPIEDVNLPLLEKLRASLSDINADACCYPYSAKNATEIKNLSKLYVNVIRKSGRLNQELQSVANQIRKETLTKLGYKATLASRSSMPTSQRKQYLAQLSTAIGVLRRLNKKKDALTEQLSQGNRYREAVRSKIEAVFFARNNWKLKDSRGKPLGSLGKPDPNDIELISKGESVSHLTIYEAIQEETSHLEADNPDIHPIPWKSLLIIPRGIEGLPDNWDKQSLNRTGQAPNKLKFTNAGTTSALVGTWEQFATWGTKGFQNPLQKALSSATHNVSLHADVRIHFNELGQIVPNVPWWDNEAAAIAGKNQIGQHPTEEEEAVRSRTTIGRSEVGISHLKNSGGVQFVSQVGFAWQYKIPQHSRSTIENTPWELATDKNGDPYKDFNLPKSTTLYAVRLVFIKADGSVTPISNIITGSDVQRRMEYMVEKDKGTYDVFNTQDPAGRKRDEKYYTQVSIADRKRLTRKARALLNVTAASSSGELKKRIDAQRTILNLKDVRVQTTEQVLQGALAVSKVVEDAIKDSKGRIETNGLTVPAITGTLLLTKPGVNTAQNVFDLITGGVGAPAGYIPGDDSQQYVQASLYKEQVSDVDLMTAMARKNDAIDIYNVTLEKVEALEREQMTFLAGGTDKDSALDCITTIHAPGLEGKDREISQVISFTKRPFFYKKNDEEKANAIAIANGEDVPYDRPGYWDPWRQDLPDEACVLMEPWLRQFKNEELLGKLNANTLRASNYDASRAIPDVTSDIPVSFSQWLLTQKKISSEFQNAGNARQLTTSEQRLNDFYLNRTTANISKSIQYARQRNILDSINAQTEAAKQEFEKEQQLLKAQEETTQQEKQNFKLNEETTILAENAAVKALKDNLEQLQKDIVAQEAKGKAKLEEIARTENLIKPLETQGAANLTAQDSATLQNLKADLAAKQGELTAVNKEVQRLQGEIAKSAQDYTDELRKAANAKNAEFEKALRRTAADLEKLRSDYDKKLEQLTTKQEQETFNVDRKIKMLEKIARENIDELEKDILNGDIRIIEKNNATRDANTVIAPADIKNGGGYFWKQSVDIDIIPYGQYLGYDRYAKTGDRQKLLWTSVNSDEPPKDPEQLVRLYEINNTDNELVQIKARDIQPVLLDRVFVHGRDNATTDLVPTESLYKLAKSNTPSKHDKSLFYHGLTRANTTTRTIDGQNVEEYVLSFFETLPKPGTLVQFTWESTFNDEAGKSRTRRLANRLRNSPDLQLDSSVNLQYGAVLSGRIVTTRLANISTTTSVNQIQALKNKVAQEKAGLTTAETTSPIDVTAIEQAKKQLRNAESALKAEEDKQGKFLYGEYISSTAADKWTKGFQAVAVADVEIVPGLIVENVLLHDIRPVSISKPGLSTSLVASRQQEGNIFGEISGLTSYHDDTYDIIVGDNVIEKVRKESLYPVLDDQSIVLYRDVDNKIKEGKILDFQTSSLAYNIEDTTSANKRLVKMENIIISDRNVDNTQSKFVSFQRVKNNPNIISQGMIRAKNVAQFHRFVAENSNELTDFIDLHMKDKNDANNGNRSGEVVINGDTYQTFNTAPAVLFRAELEPADDMAITSIIGNLRNKADLDKLLAKRLSGQNLRGPVFKPQTVTVDVVAISDDPGVINKDVSGTDIDEATITIADYVKQVNGTYRARYINIAFEDLASIKVPQVVKIDNERGYVRTSSTTVQNLKPVVDTILPKLVRAVPQKASVSHMKITSDPKPKFQGFVVSTASENESETGIITEEEEINKEEGYTTSWSKPVEQEIAMWATSSSSDEAVVTSSKERVTPVPMWATTSSSSETEEELGAWAESSSTGGGGFASSTSESQKSTQMGGFVSATSSDDETDNLHAIISKIDRVSDSQAAWVEESDNEGD